MGSPMVFQTAPPQPASNARATCPPVFVGGPEASQNGFGLVTPANFTLRSAMFHLLPDSCYGALRSRRPEPLINATRGGHSFGYGVHHFFSAVRAISRRKK